jgi:probable phosphoglycerate mutase
MRVIFVRHGLAKSNEDPLEGIVGQPSDLTAEGYRQVQAAARFLGEIITSKTVYTSPLPRTRQTAQIIAETLQLQTIIDDRLAEIYKGDWQGRPVREVVELEAQIDIDERPTTRPPHGENWRDVAERVYEFIEDNRKTGVQELLIVSHDHPIRMGIGLMLGKPLATWEDMSLDNASVTELDNATGHWQLHPEVVNVRPYLMAQYKTPKL